jgi:polar amino acid transport system substrate-binding protein
MTAFSRPCIGARALLVVLAFALYRSSCLGAEPRVLVLNETNAPPFSNPERTGFYDVVVTEALRRAGLGVRIVTLPAERALLLSNSGASDGELNRTPTVEKFYPNLVRVPEKLGEMQFVIFSKDGSILGNLEAVRGRPVGFIRGWKIFEQATAGNTDAIAAEDADQMFRLLQLDRIDAALYERYMGRAYLKAHAVNDVRDLDPPLRVLEGFIFLHKRHAGKVPAIAAALRAMKRDGSYQRAYRERFLPYIGKRSR